MEFIKRMKKREFIEMGLKTFAALILAFIAIILMEGMIYSITLNAYKTKATSTTTTKDTIAYCIKDGKNKDGETTYFILHYNEGATRNGASSDWSASSTTKLTKEQCIEKYEIEHNAKIVWHAPNAFDFTITPVHIIVIILFVGAVGGYFSYRFVKLNKSYNQVEDTYKKTGTIEITNK